MSVEDIMAHQKEYQKALAFVIQKGYNNIREYVEAKAEAHGIPTDTARYLLGMLGYSSIEEEFENALVEYKMNRRKE